MWTLALGKKFVSLTNLSEECEWSEFKCPTCLWIIKKVAVRVVLLFGFSSGLWRMGSLFRKSMFLQVCVPSFFFWETRRQIDGLMNRLRASFFAVGKLGHKQNWPLPWLFHALIHYFSNQGRGQAGRVEASLRKVPPAARPLARAPASCHCPRGWWGRNKIGRAACCKLRVGTVTGRCEQCVLGRLWGWSAFRNASCSVLKKLSVAFFSPKQLVCKFGVYIDVICAIYVRNGKALLCLSSLTPLSGIHSRTVIAMHRNDKTFLFYKTFITLVSSC